MGERLPWETYNSGKLHSGWVYPARRDDIAEALVAASAEVGQANRNIPGGLVSESSVLLGASFSSASRAGYISGDLRINRASVRVYAVRRDDLDFARAHIQTWLPRAAEWLATGATRGNAWLASEHLFTVYFSGTDAWADES